MAKNLKLTIKNTQIAEAINLSGLKSKLAKKKQEESPETSALLSTSPLPKTEHEEGKDEATPRVRARSKSAFADAHGEVVSRPVESLPEDLEVETETSVPEKPVADKPTEFSTPNILGDKEEVRAKTSAELRQELFGSTEVPPVKSNFTTEPLPKAMPTSAPPQSLPEKTPVHNKRPEAPLPQRLTDFRRASPQSYTAPPQPERPIVPYEKLGPTGKHIKDYDRPKPPPPPPPAARTPHHAAAPRGEETKEWNKPKVKPKTGETTTTPLDTEQKKTLKSPPPKFKEFKDIKPAVRKTDGSRQFDARDRQGLRGSDEDQQWRKRRAKGGRQVVEDTTIRPSSLNIRVPVSIKDLASEMKLKASQLISKLFLQGLLVTLNDLLEDETVIQLLGHEFGCDITINTTEEQRIRITDRTIKEELQGIAPELLKLRPPVVAFMGHVDHGKTSLIDAIRKSNRAAGEAGAITQHIGAFRCHTAVGDIAILDTPGHEAFSAMRARGADVTDIVVLVVAGDEGLRQQTIEAIQHAKAAKVIIVVAINKCDKPNFNADNVYRQLSEQELLPESWGGQTITVNCSAVTGEGISQLLEMLALQAEVLELRADPQSRARGTVLESEMHKGMGAVATVLVQNGTLRRGDAVVFGQHWGRIKTMHNEYRKELQEADPSTPVEITGLSGLPEAGQEFVVVKSEKEAREIAEVRSQGARQSHFLTQQKRTPSIENMLQASKTAGKKVLNIVLRADVQGSLEALKSALMKIESDKAEINIIFTGIGEVSESDVQLAAASKAIILGFHTQIESHAEPIVKELGVQVKLHDIIYHAVDDIKAMMAGLLEKIALEVEKGKALVKATFKSSHTGIIAGCQVTEGEIHRKHSIRVRRGSEIVWKGTISSLKRVKEDVREVQKGVECGIFLNNFPGIQEGDVIEAYEITYISQEL